MGKPSSKSLNAAKTYTADVADTVLNVSTETNHLIYAISLDDATGTKTYLQMFDAQSGDVTLGTTVADFVLSVIPNGTGGAVFPIPFQFTVGCSIACTTTPTGLTASSSRVSITFASGS